MELNDLKLDWKNAGGTFKNEADLQQMTKIAHLPSLKKIRTKLIVETIGLVSFLFIYYDGFDGDKKPFYANLVLILGVLLYILNDVIGYISITQPVRKSSLKLSLQHYLKRIKHLSVFSLIISMLYSISLIIFFTSVISFTREKGIILTGITIVLFQLVFFSFKIWSKWIKQLEEQLKDFDFGHGK